METNTALKQFILDYIAKDFSFEGEETWEEIEYNDETLDMNVCLREDFDEDFVEGSAEYSVSVYGTIPDVHNKGFMTTDTDDVRLEFNCHK